MRERGRGTQWVKRKDPFRLMVPAATLVVVATRASSPATSLLTDRGISTALGLAHRDKRGLRERLRPVITAASRVTLSVVSRISALTTLRDTPEIVGPSGRPGSAPADIAADRLTRESVPDPKQGVRGLEVGLAFFKRD